MLWHKVRIEHKLQIIQARYDRKLDKAQEATYLSDIRFDHAVKTLHGIGKAISSQCIPMEIEFVPNPLSFLQSEMI
jgi:GTP cyclohydrolase III